MLLYRPYQRLLLLTALGTLLVSPPIHAETVDYSFNGNGFFSFTRMFYSEAASDVAIDSQGRILAAYTFQDETDRIWPGVVRLLPSGFADPSFGFLGLWLEQTVDGYFDSASGDKTGVHITVDSQDRPIITWSHEFDDGGKANVDWAIRRITNTGSPDLYTQVGFDLEGGATTDLADFVGGIDLLPNGKLALWGHAQFNGLDADAAVALLAPIGIDSYALDTGFSFDGKVTVGFDVGVSKHDQFADLVWDPATTPLSPARLLLVGASITDATSSAMMAVRMFADTGALDVTFSVDGRATYVHQPFLGTPRETNQFSSVARASNGDYFAAGNTGMTGLLGFQEGAVAKIAAGGELDLSWGSIGWSVFRVTDRTVIENKFHWVEDLMLDPLERPVVAGYFEALGSNADHHGFVGRLTANGSGDPSFEVAGASDPLDGFNDYLFDLAGVDYDTRIFAIALNGDARQVVIAGQRYGESQGVNRADTDFLISRISLQLPLFADGFESGNTFAW